MGTGHAVAQTREVLTNTCEDVLVLYGDTPLLKASTVRRLIESHRKKADSCTLLTAVLESPASYGRIVRLPNGKIKGIVEEVEADPEQKEIKEVNAGAYCFRAEQLFRALGRIKISEAKREYFLTDCIAVLAEASLVHSPRSRCATD